MSFLLRPINDRTSEEANKVISIIPEPCFVVKTKVTDHGRTSLLTGTKTFINICHNAEVPLPEVDFNPSIVYPLIMNNKWEIPIITSSIRQDTDKKGNLCYVCDCCINSKSVTWIQKDLQLREILVEWCLESCELREEVELSRDEITFPKLKKKGAGIPPLQILSQELKEDFNKTIDKMINQENDNPVSILEMKRDLMDTDDATDDNLPPLFPINNSGTKKPLIQEIEDLSITDRSSRSDKLIQKALNYELKMGKCRDTTNYHLKIEISSEINSSLDYETKYDPKDNKLAYY